MGFLSFFKLKLFDPDEFDKELTQLTQGISRTRGHILALSKKRRAVRHNLIYSLLIAYVAFIAFRYRIALNNLGPLASGRSHAAIFFSGQESYQLIHSVVIPFLIAAFVYLVDTLFRLVIRNKEKTLTHYLKRHRAKIDDLKRITNFNTTNRLLQKYGKLESPSNSSATTEGTKSSPITGGDMTATKQSVNKVQGSMAPKKLPPTVNRPAQAPTRPLATIVSPTLLHKSIQDRLLDIIIGSDHNESVEVRYALICANCYTHNGLAPPNCVDPYTVTYICRQCGFINGATPESKLESPEMDSDGPVDEPIDEEPPMKLTADKIIGEVAEKVRNSEKTLASNHEDLDE